MQSSEKSKELLSAFIDEVCPTSHLRVETDLGDGFVRLRSDEAERRQAAHDIRSSEDIVIELLRNARDAQAHTIYLATTKAGPKRTIVVIDDGVGIPPTHHDLVFEPRVTSKLDSVHMDKWGVHGRGMALFSIAMNSEKACVASSAPNLGASIAVHTDTNVLHERVDQSTFPQMVVAEKGRAVIKGPHNINRITVEFALEHRRSLEVYLGSPAEIAATIYHHALGSANRTRLSSCDLDALPLVSRLGQAASDKELAAICASLGLELSSRTARRIMDGQIGPLDSLSHIVEGELLSQVDLGGTASSPKRDATRLSPKRRNPRIQREDLDRVGDSVRSTFDEIASAYYLSPDVPIDVKVVKGALRLTIPLVAQDE